MKIGKHKINYVDGKLILEEAQLENISSLYRKLFPQVIFNGEFCKDNDKWIFIIKSIKMGDLIVEDGKLILSILHFMERKNEDDQRDKE